MKYEQIIAGFRALQTSVMERLPDVDLGSPGPLVHTLERLHGYENELMRSVRRQPSRQDVAFHR